MSLITLSPDLLGYILSFQSTSYASLPLWLSGNRLLQRKLALGVTMVSLENLTEIALCRVPRYLEELPHLLHLKIHRDNKRILYPKLARETIMRINSGLKSLSLMWRDARLILRYPEVSDDSNASSNREHSSTESIEPEWTLKSGFPSLETLLLPGLTYSSLSSLPPSLTSLTANETRIKNDADAFLRALPPQMLHLKLEQLEHPPDDVIKCISSLPLQSFCAGPSYTGLVLLPTLTSLEGYICLQAWTNEFLETLPPSMTSLRVVPIINYDDVSEGVFPSFERLTSLKSLGSERSELLMNPRTLRTLPPTLTSLTMSADLEHVQISGWPRDLQSLCWTPMSAELPTEMFPSSLTELEICASGQLSQHLRIISLLPRMLVSLKLYIEETDGEQDIEFPPHLHTLHLRILGDSIALWVNVALYRDKLLESGSESQEEDDEDAEKEFYDGSSIYDSPAPPRSKLTTCFPFHKIPRGITDLRLDCLIPASKLRFLPPFLTRLNATDIFEDADFNSQHPDNVAHMKYLVEIGKREVGGVAEKAFILTADQEASASIMSLLPKTLAYFCLKGHAMMYSSDWARFPPRLEEFHLEWEHRTLSPNFLLHAPFTHLKKISVSLSGLGDEHIKALSRKIRNASFGHRAPLNPLPSINSINHWPVALRTEVVQGIPRALRISLESRRQRLLASSDGEELRLLISSYMM